MTRLLGPSLGLLLLAAPAVAHDDDPPSARKLPGGGATPKRAPDGMTVTGLSPAKPVENLCVFSYRVGTASPPCQRFCTQGFGYFYSYVWMEAARNFETALTHDPECAYAWLMLSRSLQRWGKGAAVPPANPFAGAVGGVLFAGPADALPKSPVEFALGKARTLMPKATPREQLLIQARLQELGKWPAAGPTAGATTGPTAGPAAAPAAGPTVAPVPDERRKKAQATLDELLTLHEDDEEGWYWRAQVAEGANGPIPFYKALLRLNPLHPGANHELVHFYEGAKRPALGWPYAEAYIQSSPGLAHAFHMQAHLATRIGKWQNTVDRSLRAMELETAYHAAANVKPAEDHQFSHHLEVLTRGLVHDGRFAEARRVKSQALGYGFNFRADWLRMAMAEGDWPEAAKLVEQLRRTDKAGAAYFAALVALEKGDTTRAAAEVDTLRQAGQGKRSDKGAELKLWEAQGRLLCRTGQGEAGLKLLQRAVEKSAGNYAHHAWGNGAVFMESWGLAALDAGNAADAREAFQEALAHDTGSVRGALGMWAVCDRLGAADEADRFLKVARRCWAKADPKDFERLKADLAGRASKLPRATATAAVGGG